MFCCVWYYKSNLNDGEIIEKLQDLAQRRSMRVFDDYMFNNLSEVRCLAAEWMDDLNWNHPQKSLWGMSLLDYIRGENNGHISDCKGSSLLKTRQGYKRHSPSAALNSTSQLPENAIENMTQREKSLLLVCLKNGKSSLLLQRYTNTTYICVLILEKDIDIDAHYFLEGTRQKTLNSFMK